MYINFWIWSRVQSFDTVLLLFRKKNLRIVYNTFTWSWTENHCSLGTALVTKDDEKIKIPYKYCVCGKSSGMGVIGE